MTKAVSKLVDYSEMKCYKWILKVTWTEHQKMSRLGMYLKSKRIGLGATCLGKVKVL